MMVEAVSRLSGVGPRHLIDINEIFSQK